MCGILRDPKQDKRKSAAQLKEQIDTSATCTLAWCNEPLTTYAGPGANRLCRSHQKMQREYGGLGRVDRPWSFSREWSCTWCGYSPKDDPWFSEQQWESEEHMNRAMRSMLTGDHIIRKADGGTDDKTNVQTLCQNCDAKKTALNHDHKRAKVI